MDLSLVDGPDAAVDAAMDLSLVDGPASEQSIPDTATLDLPPLDQAGLEAAPPKPDQALLDGPIPLDGSTPDSAWPPDGPVKGKTIYVALTGTDSSTCGDKVAPCRTIGEGYGKAKIGDTVDVGAGIYNATLDSFPIVLKKGVTLKGAGPGATKLSGPGPLIKCGNQVGHNVAGAKVIGVRLMATTTSAKSSPALLCSDVFGIPRFEQVSVQGMGFLVEKAAAVFVQPQCAGLGNFADCFTFGNSQGIIGVSTVRKGILSSSLNCVRVLAGGRVNLGTAGDYGKNEIKACKLAGLCHESSATIDAMGNTWSSGTPSKGALCDGNSDVGITGGGKVNF